MEVLLDTAVDIAPITGIINTWIAIGQALVASIGALAFVIAFTRTAKKHKL